MLARRRRQQLKHPLVVPPYVAPVIIYATPHRTLSQLARTRPEDIVGSPEWIAENRRLSQRVR